MIFRSTAHSDPSILRPTCSISGAVLTETVFSLHGVGRFLLDSVLGQDYPAAGAAFYLLTLITVASNLAADFLVQFADPRIRTGGGGA